MVISFAVLGFYGGEIYREAPPVPEKVVTEDGTVIFTKSDILDGQNVWQSIGGQEVGTIWGHGSYVAPDWSADWLHREAVYVLDVMSGKEYGKEFAELDKSTQASLKTRLQQELRTNTYDASNGTVTISGLRADAIRHNSEYYRGLFMNDPALHKTREAYAIPENSIKTEDRMHKMNAFFFWAAWSCITNRPGQDIT